MGHQLASAAVFVSARLVRSMMTRAIAVSTEATQTGASSPSPVASERTKHGPRCSSDIQCCGCVRTAHRWRTRCCIQHTRDQSTADAERQESLNEDEDDKRNGMRCDHCQHDPACQQ